MGNQSKWTGGWATPSPHLRSSPRPGETELRRLGLGFRAPYVDKATRRVLEGKLDLGRLVRLPYLEAKAELMECPGIGSKIADCIAVFSLEKLEAFPIDVWVRRALEEWYFPGQKTPPDRVLLEWAPRPFRPLRGLRPAVFVPRAAFGEVGLLHR